MTLWFGDERGYNATKCDIRNNTNELWFGDERGYNATYCEREKELESCGLVMKEDITQPASALSAFASGCGLVMKEDITQPLSDDKKSVAVVVW